jgi:MbtH protein
MSAFDSDDIEYVVLKNDKGEYALWPAFKELPPGWHDTGQRGTKEECCAYVDKVWYVGPRRTAR